MAENVYECLFLLDSNHYARDPAGTAQLVDRLIEEAGGTVLVSRLWNEQRLAYPIEGHRKGTYWLAYFRMPGSGVPVLNRACQIHDTVLRQLVLKVDPRLVETLVAHAKGRPSRRQPSTRPRNHLRRKLPTWRKPQPARNPQGADPSGFGRIDPRGTCQTTRPR